MNEFRSDVVNRADLLRITSDMKVAHHGILTPDGRLVQVEVRPVAPSIGHLYQSRLHYLMSPRADIEQAWGLFEQNCEYPLLYLAFSPASKQSLLRQIQFDGERPTVLARSVSVVDLPMNAYSYTLAIVAARLRSMFGTSGVMTAVNPYLGFTAASVFAAGFRPIARRPVSYSYDENGNFVTRRFRPQLSQATRRHMPPNIQFYRSTEKSSHFQTIDLNKAPLVEQDDPTEHTPDDNIRRSVEAIANTQRANVEVIWSTKTMHPDFIGIASPHGSIGQCGVTSVHLARELSFAFPNLEIEYCYGDLNSRDTPVAGIRRHCWLRVKSHDTEPLIVDCTPDQPGGIEAVKVIVKTEAELAAMGLFYVARTLRTIDQLVSDRVWPRYLTLADALFGGTHANSKLV